MDRHETPRGWQADTALIGLLALAKLALHLAFVNRYGYFRDELYYLACGHHLDWGYVDFPPLIGLMAAFVRRTMGDSLLAIRFLPILA
ncbi:MAG TPA: hypothetical protein PKZ25_16960, partial [Candidatus Hydrogenedentes bacterium]|nr:hypothetical protein [Candidatus Hydrogenedentota bacterium]